MAAASLGSPAQHSWPRAHVPFGDFIFGGKQIAVLVVGAYVLLNPIVEVARANAEGVELVQNGRHAHGRFAAIRETIETNSRRIDIGQYREPLQGSLVLADDVTE